MFKSLWRKTYASRLVGKAIAIWYILCGRGVIYRIIFHGDFSLSGHASNFLTRESIIADIELAVNHQVLLAWSMSSVEMLTPGQPPKLSGQ